MRLLLTVDKKIGLCECPFKADSRQATRRFSTQLFCCVTLYRRVHTKQRDASLFSWDASYRSRSHTRRRDSTSLTCFVVFNKPQVRQIHLYGRRINDVLTNAFNLLFWLLKRYRGITNLALKRCNLAKFVISHAQWPQWNNKGIKQPRRPGKWW